jgi:hypothetical protein
MPPVLSVIVEPDHGMLIDNVRRQLERAELDLDPITDISASEPEESEGEATNAKGKGKKSKGKGKVKNRKHKVQPIPHEWSEDDHEKRIAAARIRNKQCPGIRVLANPSDFTSSNKLTAGYLLFNHTLELKRFLRHQSKLPFHSIPFHLPKKNKGPLSP